MDQKILLIQSRRDEFMIFALQQSGYQVLWQQPADAVAITPDLVIEDRRHGGAEEWRVQGAIPRELPRLVLLPEVAGAKATTVADILEEPFSPAELLSRISRLLARVQRTEGQTYQYGELVLDTERKGISFQGRRVSLTWRQYRIVERLMSRPERIFSRDELIDSTGTLVPDVEPRAIDQHIRRIRVAFKQAGVAEDFIETVHGFGYCFLPKRSESEKRFVAGGFA